MVKASTSRREDLGFKSRLRWDFPGSSHTSDLKIGAPVATLLGACCSRVSAGTGWPSVCMLGLWWCGALRIVSMLVWDCDGVVL